MAKPNFSLHREGKEGLGCCGARGRTRWGHTVREGAILKTSFDGTSQLSGHGTRETMVPCGHINPAREDGIPKCQKFFLPVTLHISALIEGDLYLEGESGHVPLHCLALIRLCWKPTVSSRCCSPGEVGSLGAGRWIWGHWDKWAWSLFPESWWALQFGRLPLQRLTQSHRTVSHRLSGVGGTS